MKKFKIGLQLYSIHSDVEEDMEGALKKVKEMGYDCVEFAGYFGKSAEEVKALLEKYDLEGISAHHTIDFFDDAGSIEYLKKIGVKYVAIPWYDKSELAGTSVWSRTAAKFEALGKKLAENQIKLLYHNHDFEMEKHEGKTLMDWIFEDVSQDVIDPEFDTCWVEVGGENVCETLERYRGRVEVLHVKDYMYEYSSEEGDDGFRYMAIGHGVSDFEKILSVAEKCGTDYIIVEAEQNKYTVNSGMKDAQLSIQYLRSLGI